MQQDDPRRRSWGEVLLLLPPIVALFFLRFSVENLKLPIKMPAHESVTVPPAAPWTEFLLQNQFIRTQLQIVEVACWKNKPEDLLVFRREEILFFYCRDGTFHEHPQIFWSFPLGARHASPDRRRTLL